MIVCLDLEGVLVPEIWIEVAKRTKINDLRLTTRDISDYSKLMAHRVKVLRKNKITLDVIQSVIAGIKPLPGAKKFVDTIRSKKQLIILSDTFYEFAGPLMKQLGYPTIFCNTLKVDRQGFLSGFEFRQKDGKTKAVKAFQSLNFHVCAAGDSYNDVGMLKAANSSMFFRAPDKIREQFPKIPHTQDYSVLIKKFLA